MPDRTLLARSHVLAAMSDYDRLGQKEFLRRFGFGRSRAHTVWHNGNEYDPMAILGVAYLHATGTPATPEEFLDGEAGAAQVLKDLGFDVVVDEQALAQQQERKAPAAKARKKQPPAAAKPVAVCPICHMATPASGICDFCDG